MVASWRYFLISSQHSKLIINTAKRAGDRVNNLNTSLNFAAALHPVFRTPEPTRSNQLISPSIDSPPSDVQWQGVAAVS